MCTVALQIAGALFGAYGQYQQGQAQEAAYKAQAANAEEQAKVAEQNAKIANRQQESVADAYADKQSELRKRMAVARGQQAATYGARGLEGGTGSALDVLAGSYESYENDTRNLLSNQRNDVYDKQVDEYNFNNQALSFKNQASAARSAASNAASAGRLGALTTLVGSAASISAYSDKYKAAKTATSATSATSASKYSFDYNGLTKPIGSTTNKRMWF